MLNPAATILRPGKRRAAQSWIATASSRSALAPGLPWLGG